MCFQLDVARDQSNKTHIPILHLMTQTGDLKAIKKFPKVWSMDHGGGPSKATSDTRVLEVSKKK